MYQFIILFHSKQLYLDPEHLEVFESIFSKSEELVLIFLGKLNALGNLKF